MTNRLVHSGIIFSLLLYMPSTIMAAAGETFYLGINIGAPSSCSVIIDSHAFSSHLSTTGFSLTGTVSTASFCSKNTALIPLPTDTMVQKLLNSSIWTNDTLRIYQTVPNGVYNVYVWGSESYATNGRNLTLSIEGKVWSDYCRLIIYHWQKYGPYEVTVSDGVLNINIERVTGNPVLKAIQINSVTSSTPICTLNAKPGAGGTVSPKGRLVIAKGESQTFTVQPATGYQITQVSVGGVNLGPITSYTFTNVQASDSIKATFSPITYPVTVTAGTGGTISPSGTVNVAHGASQIFTVTPNTNYSIAQVTVNGDNKGAVAVCTLSNVQAAATVSATFTALPVVTVTASAGTGGTISPSGAVTVALGGSQVFAITPNTGYRVAGVTVDGIGRGAITTYTFVNLQTNATISATFVENITGTTVRGYAGRSSPAIEINDGAISFFSTTDRTVEIVDVGGRIVLSNRIGANEMFVVTKASLTTGIYFLRMKDDAANVISKKITITGQ